MTDWFENVYSSPEKYGLTTIGEVSWSEPCYDFDLTAVWRSSQGVLYWADDSGCSCPAPFEDYRSLEELKTGSGADLARHLNERLADMAKSSWSARDIEQTRPQVADLLAKVMV
jgi:hypothetical protein